MRSNAGILGDHIHDAWFEHFDDSFQLTLHEPGDPDASLYAKLFNYAAQFAADAAPVTHESELIHAALSDVVAPGQPTSTEARRRARGIRLRQ